MFQSDPGGVRSRSSSPQGAQQPSKLRAKSFRRRSLLGLYVRNLAAMKEGAAESAAARNEAYALALQQHAATAAAIAQAVGGGGGGGDSSDGDGTSGAGGSGRALRAGGDGGCRSAAGSMGGGGGRLVPEPDGADGGVEQPMLGVAEAAAQRRAWHGASRGMPPGSASPHSLLPLPLGGQLQPLPLALQAGGPQPQPLSPQQQQRSPPHGQQLHRAGRFDAAMPPPPPPPHGGHAEPYHNAAAMMPYGQQRHQAQGGGGPAAAPGAGFASASLEGHGGRAWAAGVAAGGFNDVKPSGLRAAAAAGRFSGPTGLGGGGGGSAWGPAGALGAGSGGEAAFAGARHWGQGNGRGTHAPAVMPLGVGADRALDTLDLSAVRHTRNSGSLHPDRLAQAHQTPPAAAWIKAEAGAQAWDPQPPPPMAWCGGGGGAARSAEVAARSPYGVAPLDLAAHHGSAAGRRSEHRPAGARLQAHQHDAWQADTEQRLLSYPHSLGPPSQQDQPMEFARHLAAGPTAIAATAHAQHWMGGGGAASAGPEAGAPPQPSARTAAGGAPWPHPERLHTAAAAGPSAAGGSGSSRQRRGGHGMAEPSAHASQRLTPAQQGPRGADEGAADGGGRLLPGSHALAHRDWGSYDEALPQHSLERRSSRAPEAAEPEGGTAHRASHRPPRSAPAGFPAALRSWGLRELCFPEAWMPPPGPHWRHTAPPVPSKALGAGIAAAVEEFEGPPAAVQELLERMGMLLPREQGLLPTLLRYLNGK
ncbi:hypothetical protein HYH03_015222 [Edaphochlamys debaryana]|uniref:Uncharacterized protein n=1 Tax=Edaphochlamys debaryana TaxID=47281 RepID=A0A836BSS3_9CHLO|nr:hypothetical protein HYH03_015222 [Edaphochlamys debaryana]|eukprot:KAG2486129.1 hypothetical protein HYH03_015222 [Edaphochlamys debaryana]